MEKVYRKGDTNKYFGETSGLMYDADEVREINGCYWHCHPWGQPVIEVGELDEMNAESYVDTRVHGGYPQYPLASGKKPSGSKY